MELILLLRTVILLLRTVILHMVLNNIYQDAHVIQHLFKFH